jgi:hypothetical protein
MLSNWENIKKNVKGELSDAAAATRKYLKIGKSRLGRMNTDKSLNKTYRELGVETNKQINEDAKKDILKNPKIINLINKIKVFKQDIVDNKLKVQIIRKESESGPQSLKDEDTEIPANARKKKNV